MLILLWAWHLIWVVKTSLGLVEQPSLYLSRLVSFSFLFFLWPCKSHWWRLINTPSNQIVRIFWKIIKKLSLECSFTLKFSLASTNLAVLCGVLKSLDSSLVVWLYPLKIKGPKDKLGGVAVSKWDLSLWFRIVTFLSDLNSLILSLPSARVSLVLNRVVLHYIWYQS